MLSVLRASPEGSAPGEAWHFLRGESPRRVRPNQPPVSSVAYAKEEVKWIDAPLPVVEESSVRQLELPNNAYEAYTENPVGRRGQCASPKRLSLVTDINAGGDGVPDPEANTKGSFMVRSWRACRGRRAWHAGREMPRNLGDPMTSRLNG